MSEKHNFFKRNILKLLIICAVVTLILLPVEGCTKQESISDEPDSPTIFPGQQEPSSTIITSSPTTITAPEETDSPLEVAEFPLPCSDMFALDGVYAAIFDADIDYWYSLRSDAIDKSNFVYIPYIGLIDSYVTDDDAIHYICYSREYYYYLENSADLENPIYRIGIGVVHKTFSIAENSDGEVVCTDVQTCDDGEGWDSSIYRLCGPREDIADTIIEYAGHYDEFPLEITDIVPSDSDKLFNIYLNHFFVE